MRLTKLPSGESVPVLGLGTWQLGDVRDRHAQEIAALQAGIDLGLTLIDTAEMYGNGASEQLVARAIEGRRESVFLVTKVLPTNATSKQSIHAACERSLRRLRVDAIDLYLLHWRQSEKLATVVEAFGDLVTAGKIRHWGVSNFDDEDMRELATLHGGSHVATNQVLYNVYRRGIEFDLLPAMRARKTPIMAYTPIEQGKVLKAPTLRAIAATHGATPSQVALAWTLRGEGVIAIPRSGNADHVRDNARALDIELTAADLAEIDRAFAPPKKARALEMI